MCGIAGIVILDQGRAGLVRQDCLDRMTDAQTHRGPDGRGIWISQDRRVGLGHRRLAILDLSPRGRQPMANEDESIWVTFNGEIYNYRDLRVRLERSGHRFRSATDTEVLVHLYEDLGTSFVEELDGDFAFGLWDGRDRRFVLARDRAGVKPLYYMRIPGAVLFASEVKGILQYPGVERVVDRDALYHYLTFLVSPPPMTLFRGINKLEGASTLVINVEEGCEGLSSARKYWRPEPTTLERRDHLDEQLESLFEASVRKRLMADVPVGVLFSGGIDSTLNTVFFQRAVAPASVHTFTVGMEGTDLFEDERDTAKQRAKELGSIHHEVTITVRDLLETAQELPRLQDEPISDPVSVPLYFVSRLARDCGTTVLHAGEGADELFCGYDKYRRVLRHYRRYWTPMANMPKAVPWLAFQSLRWSAHPRRRKIADVLRRMLLGQEFFVSSAVAYYEAEKQRVLSRAFRAESAERDSFGTVADQYKYMRRHHSNASMLEVLTFLELEARLPELLLMRVDKMSMAHGVEVRVPFLDRDLVDFALAVPDDYKLRDGVSKEPLKRIAARVVGRARAYEAKRGFGAPIQDWFRGELGRAMEVMLDEDELHAGEFFDLSVLRRRLRAGPGTVNDAFQLWVVYNFLNWRRIFDVAST